MTMTARNKYIAITIAIFITECLVATKLAQITFIRGSISDVLAAAFLYFLIQSIKLLDPSRLAAGVFIFCAAVEVSQYFRLAGILGFSKGSLPSILLGNTFNMMDILMYFLGSLAAFSFDRWVLQRRDGAGQVHP